ncbi:hypothetical protein BDV96DRAFT_694736 [Lophiotrema nucula]|uniref:Uncharacterized protein n=1 Tax=Lophiotrema nucula TaxID=690887 RepID=A0A6A5YFC0_9PLEO|nr:hypothetical protein BDV96DRAFT_694736 [Lophiotrema nucula]
MHFAGLLKVAGNSASNADAVPQDLQKAMCAGLVPDPTNQKHIAMQDIDAFARFVMEEMKQSDSISKFASVLSSKHLPYRPPGERLLWLLTAAARLLAASPSISIDEIVTALIGDEIVAEDCRSGQRKAEAVCCIFCVLGWLIFLYRPDAANSNTDHLSIQTQDCPCFNGESQSIEESSRPFFEVVKVFNALGNLKTSDDSSSQRDLQLETHPRLLHPSLFNASILTRFGDLEIVWVDSIGSHLDLDIGAKKLYLFRFSCFLRTQSFAGSLLPS